MMEKFVDGPNRFFDPAEKLAAVFDFSAPPARWMTYAEIAEAIGVPVTSGSMVQIGRLVTKWKLRRRRLANARLVLMPPLL